MSDIKILQIGIGPLGQKINNYIGEKQSMQVVAAVDIAQDKIGNDLGEICSGVKNGITIHSSLESLKNKSDIDIAVLTTSSSLKAITPQILEILDYGIPIVSTCEELTFPFRTNEEWCRQIDEKAKDKGVAVLSTGVNPGFLMDTLPSILTSVCRSVNHITVNRIQDAQSRRVPFQKKIGAGLELATFEKKKLDGSLRHVGLTESMLFIADAVGWEIDHTEDIISPIIADQHISTNAMEIEEGQAQGVRQIGRANVNGEEKIKLVFEAAVGTGSSYDEVIIEGSPRIHSRIEGGVHGDIATCSIVLNVIPVVLNTTPGLKTMKDLGLPSFTN